MDSVRPLLERKRRLRRELRQKLEALTEGERSKGGREILKSLLRHPKFGEASSLFIYVALQQEVETRPILEETWRRRKRLFVPRVDPKKRRMEMIELTDLKELKPGAYGILEPPWNEARVGDPKDLDLVIVPGIGFDRKGGRLGRGEGYFDRFLKEAARAYKIGLAFECQIVDSIPRDVKDIGVDEVLIG